MLNLIICNNTVCNADCQISKIENTPTHIYIYIYYIYIYTYIRQKWIVLAQKMIKKQRFAGPLVSQ